MSIVRYIAFVGAEAFSVNVSSSVPEIVKKETDDDEYQFIVPFVCRFIQPNCVVLDPETLATFHHFPPVAGENVVALNGPAVVIGFAVAGFQAGGVLYPTNRSRNQISMANGCSSTGACSSRQSA